MPTTRQLASVATVSQLRTAVKLEPRPDPERRPEPQRLDHPAHRRGLHLLADQTSPREAATFDAALSRIGMR